MTLIECVAAVHSFDTLYKVVEKNKQEGNAWLCLFDKSHSPRLPADSACCDADVYIGKEIRNNEV